MVSNKATDAVDNKILTDKEMQPLTKTQLQKHNAFFKQVHEPDVTQRAGQGDNRLWIEMALKDHVNGGLGEFFVTFDTDNDGKLSKAEGEQWWAGIFEDAGREGQTYDDEQKAIWNKLYSAIASVNEKTGESFEYADFLTTKKIIQAWMMSPKGEEAEALQKAAIEVAIEANMIQ